MVRRRHWRSGHVLFWLPPTASTTRKSQPRSGAVPRRSAHGAIALQRARMDGLYDEPRPGAPREIGDDEIATTIRKTLETLPKGATYWSLRTMAREIGHAPSTVHRIWRAFGLQPHRVETFKLSSDPLFVEKGARHRRALLVAARARRRAVC